MVVFLLLKFAIADFLADREYKNISTATISTYNFTLQEFHSYCVENNLIDADDVNNSTIKDYLLYCLHERSNNPTTRNTKLRTFYPQEYKILRIHGDPLLLGKSLSES